MQKTDNAVARNRRLLGICAIGNNRTSLAAASGSRDLTVSKIRSADARATEDISRLKRRPRLSRPTDADVVVGRILAISYVLRLTLGRFRSEPTEVLRRCVSVSACPRSTSCEQIALETWQQWCRPT